MGGDLGSLLISAFSMWCTGMRWLPSAFDNCDPCQDPGHNVNHSPSPCSHQRCFPGSPASSKFPCLSRGEDCRGEGLGQFRNSVLLSQTRKGFFKAVLRSCVEIPLLLSWVFSYSKPLGLSWAMPWLSFLLNSSFLDFKYQKLQRIVFLIYSPVFAVREKKKEKLKFPPSQLTPLSAAVNCCSPEGSIYRKLIYC